MENIKKFARMLYEMQRSDNIPEKYSGFNNPHLFMYDCFDNIKNTMLSYKDQKDREIYAGFLIDTMDSHNILVGVENADEIYFAGFEEAVKCSEETSGEVLKLRILSNFLIASMFDVFEIDIKKEMGKNPVLNHDSLLFFENKQDIRKIPDEIKKGMINAPSVSVRVLLIQELMNQAFPDFKNLDGSVQYRFINSLTGIDQKAKSIGNGQIKKASERLKKIENKIDNTDKEISSYNEDIEKASSIFSEIGCDVLAESIRKRKITE